MKKIAFKMNSTPIKFILLTKPKFFTHCKKNPLILIIIPNCIDYNIRIYENSKL